MGPHRYIHRLTFVTVAATAGLAQAASAAPLPAAVDLEVIRALPVQHDGRWMPLDTVARDYVESVTGSVDFQGQDPLRLLLAWTFDPQTWMREPLITIRNAQLRAELKLPAGQTAFSFTELAGHQPLRVIIDQAARLPAGQKPDPLQSKATDISAKLTLLQRVFNNEAIRPIPDANQKEGRWQPIVLPRTRPEPTEPVVGAWVEMSATFTRGDEAGFATAASRLRDDLACLPAAYRPPAERIALELRYNSLRPFHSAWMVMVCGAVLAAAALLVRRRWFDGLAVVGLLAGFGMLSYGLWLRWQIAGRIPAANMFESLLFLSWGMGAFAVIALLVTRNRLVPLTASALGALALFLADVLPLDGFVRPIAPVLLDTIWMTIHVPEIMVSYAVLTVAVLVAHAQVVAMALVPGRRSLIEAIDRLHYWYVHVGAILLLVGIITGSMWAASSWGRYWGWDPKEVWSLVAFLGYMAILHVRIDNKRREVWMYAVAAVLGLALLLLVAPRFVPLQKQHGLAFGGAGLAMVLMVLGRGQFATATKSIMAFWLIIMTYVGVNYVLGVGLHSYAFGTGAVSHYMFLIGGVDLAVLAACALLYLARTRRPIAVLRLPFSDS